MKTDQLILTIPYLKDTFSTRNFVRKTELLNFFQHQDPHLTEQSFRRILYFLEKERYIVSIGTGIYGWVNSSLSSQRKKFAPIFSSMAIALSEEIHENFPYIQYLTWETQTLHEFMLHQPGQRQIILEIEKDAIESVFNKLKEHSTLPIFLQPDQITFDRYIINSYESIILLPLITQSPKMKIKDNVSAKLEKILVDIFSDKDRFFTFHGQEMINIYENAFDMYWINWKTLFRYAGRRKTDRKLMNFINKKTQINLSTIWEVAE